MPSFLRFRDVPGAVDTGVDAWVAVIERARVQLRPQMSKRVILAVNGMGFCFKVRLRTLDDSADLCLAL